MDQRLHLHDAERLLCSVRPSSAFLVWSLLRGVVDGLIVGIPLALVIAIVFGILGWTGSIGLAVSIVLIVSLLAVWLRRWSHWRVSSLSVTTERILLQYPSGPTVITKSGAAIRERVLVRSGGSVLHTSLRTVKWSQYQESVLGGKTMFDLVAGSRAVCIRYGTADAQLEACYPSLPYASDLKHYLDKADAAIRSGNVSTLKPFVLKPRGKRD
ncbi:MAG: hypothetical protein Q7R81_00495 [Candidatus Peregrinibacteria bacterium]|nr:hypothetical protein [Candidatus Peregrinibacteria bacterium]